VNDTKNPLQSLGVMGPLISLVVIGLNMKWPGLGLTDADVGGIINNVFTVIGGVTGIYGRIRATSQVTITGKSIALAFLAAGALSLSACATDPAQVRDNACYLARQVMTDAEAYVAAGGAIDQGLQLKYVEFKPLVTATCDGEAPKNLQQALELLGLKAAEIAASLNKAKPAPVASQPAA
jgi:hypothetical protein